MPSDAGEDCIICQKKRYFESMRACSICKKRICVKCIKEWASHSPKCPHCATEGGIYMKLAARRVYHCPGCDYRTRKAKYFAYHFYSSNCFEVRDMTERYTQLERDLRRDYSKLVDRMGSMRSKITALRRSIQTLRETEHRIKNVIQAELQEITDDEDVVACGKYRFSVGVSDDSKLMFTCKGFKPSKYFQLVGAVSFGKGISFYRCSFEPGCKSAISGTEIPEGTGSIRLNASIFN